MAETLRDRLFAAFHAQVKKDQRTQDAADPEDACNWLAKGFTDVAMLVFFEFQQDVWRQTGSDAVNPFVACGADALICDLAACTTWEELCGDEDPVGEPPPLDDLIHRARNLVDTLGLRPDKPTHPVALPW